MAQDLKVGDPTERDLMGHDLMGHDLVEHDLMEHDLMAHDMMEHDMMEHRTTVPARKHPAVETPGLRWSENAAKPLVAKRVARVTLAPSMVAHNRRDPLINPLANEATNLTMPTAAPRHLAPTRSSIDWTRTTMATCLVTSSKR